MFNKALLCASRYLATLALVLNVGRLVPAKAQMAEAPAFEVASIRRHTTPLRRIADFNLSGPRLSFLGYTIPMLVAEAFELKNYQVSFRSVQGLDDYYDFLALVPQNGDPTRQRARRMLQTLLVERFRLAVHREQRVLNFYKLVADRKGLPMTQSDGGERCVARVGPQQPEDRNYLYEYKGCGLEALLDVLELEKPVLDRTQLSGHYNFAFVATPSFKLRNTSEPGDVSVVDAIRKIGLKLEPAREPVTILLVDHVEQPSEN